MSDAGGRSYRVETFVRDIQDDNSFSNTWAERIVTVIVRDPSTTGSPIILENTTAFDRGPS